MKRFKKSGDAKADGDKKNCRFREFAGRLKLRADIRRSRDGIRYDRQRIQQHLLMVIGLALVVTITMELFNRRSVGVFIDFVIDYPLMFLLDYFIVFNTLLVSQLFRRRIAVLSLVSLSWVTLSVVNYIVIIFRTQPFTLADVLLVDDMFSLITVYFNWFQIILMGVAIIGLIGVLVFLFLKAPRREHVHFVPAFIMLAVATAMSFGFVTIGKDSGFITERFKSIRDAYQQYGFAYTFIDTFADLGISRPDEYTPDTAESIADRTEPDHDAVVDDSVMPNIIFVQLESFFDADTLADNIIVSGNATPNFHRLMENWPSGTLYVPVVGGGTANTEFEILTGMNLDDFGAGEYPYLTVMRDVTCESVPYVLANAGYSTTAVHNYMATFYGRDQVYRNLGFETFESMEYMDDLEYGPVGWATDKSVTESTLDALDSTYGRDFVFSVTVGTHGKYPTDELLDCAAQTDSIRVIDPGLYFNQTQLQNYLNLAREMDDFIVEFLEAMEEYDEPVVCVFYGDHLPALDWDAECLDSGNMFATQYFIWNNYGAKFDAPDIEAYRLSAHLLLQLGVEDGVVFKYHQSADADEAGPGYLTELKILEYAMLYDDTGEIEDLPVYESSDMQLGIDDIFINTVNYRYGRLMVKGANFNEFSTIVIDGEAQPTVYVDSHTLAMVMEEFPTDATSLAVAQITNEDIELSRTKEWLMEDVIQ